MQTPASLKWPAAGVFSSFSGYNIYNIKEYFFRSIDFLPPCDIMVGLV